MRHSIVQLATSTLAMLGLVVMSGCQSSPWSPVHPVAGPVSPALSGVPAPYVPGSPPPYPPANASAQAGPQGPAMWVGPGMAAMPPTASPHQHAGGHNHAAGQACPHCQATNPLSKPLELFGVSSRDVSMVQPVSYQEGATSSSTLSDPCCPPGNGAYPPAYSPMGLPRVMAPMHPPGWIPGDELICDGGDEGVGTVVDADWTVRGLESEDTVGHFDTLDGRRLVEPSNRVCIYAPRFGSVRQTYGVAADVNVDQIASTQGEVGLDQFEEVDAATTTLQQLQARGQVGAKSASTFRDRTRGMGLENRVASADFNNRFGAFEDLSLIRHGTFDQDEKARLSEGLKAAESWGQVDAPQNVVDNLTADGLGTGLPAAETVSVQEKESKPELRLVKLASAADALPGEVIEFTIRFDNVGNETIGNVTILDHLSPRLEVIDGSAQCSVDAEFFVTEQNQNTQIFRAEITDPLPAGQGGIVRFKCRVR